MVGALRIENLVHAVVDADIADVADINTHIRSIESILRLILRRQSH